MSQSLAKLIATPWTEVLPRLEFAEPAAPLVAGCANALEALAALEKAKLWPDAAKLLAHALPRREAVWWACMCARYTQTPDLTQSDRLALESAEAWVFKGDDVPRREGFAHAEAAGFKTPEAWAAVGAFWSGDSIAPKGQHPVAPPPQVAAAAIFGAVQLAAVRAKPERRERRLQAFIASARAIADGQAGRLPTEES